MAGVLHRHASSWGAWPRRSVLCRFGPLFGENEIADNQRIYPRVVKATKRFARIANDRLAFDVEGRVEHEIFAGQIAKMPDQVVVKRIGGPRDGLGANRSVRMDDRGNFVALLRPDVK